MDTNLVIDYLGNNLPASGKDFMNVIVDAVPTISVITKIEVLGFNAPDEHYRTLTDFINDETLFELIDEDVEASIVIRKSYKTKLPDAIIAATALVNNLVLISRNTSDFKSIDGIKVIGPHSFK